MNENSPIYSQLTPEENILIRASCVILSEESKQLHRYRFWGKIFGTQNDYFIVQSTTLNPYELPVTQYSRDGRAWASLAPPADSAMTNAFMSGLLTGDPSTPFSYSDFNSVSKISAEPLQIQIREEDRLACLVRAIDAEGTLLPKGSYAMDATGHIVPSPMYKGMSYENCCNFENYVTFIPLNKLKVRKDAAGRRVNALQPFLKAIPETLTDRGLCFFHAIDGSTFGRCYFGWGSREINVPFLLGSLGDDSLTVDVTFLPDYDYRRTPEEADAAEAAAAAAVKAKRDAIDSEFLVSKGEEIGNAVVPSSAMDLSVPLIPDFSVSVEGDSHDGTSVDPEGTDNTSGDVSATEGETSEAESTG
ncbi:hypothetical protein BV898_12702 [Hypsibius exemplaris]|uniref:Radial spoke head protein 9 homolog n=1 Tax=Hypsibius exemplaris TaxID=2072580 RepID=A0A1W0WCU3_HYPEX|nr:hypothetical protein BV898_12702 [Hypsibius exemplaris]